MTHSVERKKDDRIKESYIEYVDATRSIERQYRNANVTSQGGGHRHLQGDDIVTSPSAMVHTQQRPHTGRNVQLRQILNKGIVTSGGAQQAPLVSSLKQITSNRLMVTTANQLRPGGATAKNLTVAGARQVMAVNAPQQLSCATPQQNIYYLQNPPRAQQQPSALSSHRQ